MSDGKLHPLKTMEIEKDEAVEGEKNELRLLQ